MAERLCRRDGCEKPVGTYRGIEQVWCSRACAEKQRRATQEAERRNQGLGIIGILQHAVATPTGAAWVDIIKRQLRGELLYAELDWDDSDPEDPHRKFRLTDKQTGETVFEGWD